MSEFIAWAAGFYEGEGHITKANTSGGPKVRINQCNIEPLELLHGYFGGYLYGPRQTKNGNQDVYEWGFNTHSQSRNFIYQISGWLSEKRLEDALSKIDRYADIVSIRYTYCSKGHNKDVLGTRPGHNGGRICKACESEYKRNHYLKSKDV